MYKLIRVNLFKELARTFQVLSLLWHKHLSEWVCFYSKSIPGSNLFTQKFHLPSPLLLRVPMSSKSGKKKETKIHSLIRKTSWPVMKGQLKLLELHIQGKKSCCIFLSNTLHNHCNETGRTTEQSSHTEEKNYIFTIHNQLHCPNSSFWFLIWFHLISKK